MKLLAILIASQLCFTQITFAQRLMDAGSLDPSILNQIPQEIQANAPHLSVFERITLCEINILGSSAPKKAVPERLANLEKQLFGEHFISQQPAIVSRINNVIFNTQLPNELVADAVADSLTKPDWASRKASTHRWLRTALQRVELLETELNNRMQKDLLLVDRIATLEKAALGAEALTGSIDQRIDELEKVVSPNQANWKGSGGNSLGVVSSVGKGLKNATKSAFQSTAEPAKSVLKSPTFWMLLIGAGALTGLYFATRNSGGGAVPASYYPDPIYGCHGAVPCHVCTDCSRCIHCNSGRSQCVPARGR